MADDTAEARIARAKQIRESIEKELGKTAGEGTPAPKPRDIRDKIHDRMRDLDKKR